MSLLSEPVLSRWVWGPPVLRILGFGMSEACGPSPCVPVLRAAAASPASQVGMSELEVSEHSHFSLPVKFQPLLLARPWGEAQPLSFLSKDVLGSPCLSGTGRLGKGRGAGPCLCATLWCEGRRSLWSRGRSGRCEVRFLATSYLSAFSHSSDL